MTVTFTYLKFLTYACFTVKKEKEKQEFHYCLQTSFWFILFNGVVYIFMTLIECMDSGLPTVFLNK